MKKYVEELKAEYKKVTWPSKKEITNATILSILLSGAISIYLGVFDFLFSKILDIIVG